MSDTKIDPSQLIVPPTFQNYTLEDFPDEKYHADKSAVGSSGTRQALDSQKAFYWGHFLGYQIEQTKELDIGKIIHTAILEGSKFKDKYVVMPKFWGKTAKGEVTDSLNSIDVKNQIAKWRSEQAPDAIVVTADERDMMIGIVDGIMEHPQGPALFTDGKPELTGYYRDPVTGIKCKVRWDFLSNNRLTMVDLKSARTSKKEKFGGKAHELGYPIQMAQYREGIREIFGVLPDTVALVAVEKKWPFETAIYYLDADDLGPAMVDYRRGLDRIAECIKSGKWPQRQKQIERLYTPTWKQMEIVNDEESNMGDDDAA